MKTLHVLFFTFLIFGNIYGQDTAAYNAKKELFPKTDVEAQFPGGDKEWIRFLSQNLNSNIADKKGAPAGSYQVIIRFIINEKGYVDKIEAEKDPGYGTAEEAIRVIKKSPQWNAAILNNKEVISWRRQPITFVVVDKKRKKKNKDEAK